MPFVLTLVGAVVFIVRSVCMIFYWMLILRIVLSWVGVSPHTNYNEILGAIYQVTDYILRPFQRIPLRMGMFDFTPMLAIMTLYLIPEMVAGLLYSIVGVMH